MNCISTYNFHVISYEQKPVLSYLSISTLSNIHRIFLKVSIAHIYPKKLEYIQNRSKPELFSRNLFERRACNPGNKGNISII